MMIVITGGFIHIVLYKDRFYVYVTNIGDIMIRLVLHKIRADFIQPPSCQEFDMHRCRVHLPNSSARMRTVMYEGRL